VQKLFKVACLSYKASNVEYRGESYKREGIVEMRKELIEKIERALP
jgi:hypothetical protein